MNKNIHVMRGRNIGLVTDKSQHKNASEVIGYRSRHVRDAIQKRPRFASKLEQKKVATQFTKFVDLLVERELMTRVDIGEAMGGKGNSTQRLYKYTLPDADERVNAVPEARMNALAKSASAFLAQIDKIAKSSAGKVDLGWAIATVFQGTDYSPEGGVDEADDHVQRTMELLNGLARYVTHEFNLVRYFRLIERFHLRYDVERDTILPASNIAMERGPVFDFFGPNIFDLVPMPSALLYAEQVTVQVEGTALFSNRPFMPTDWPDIAVPGTFAVPARAHLIRETWICVAPVLAPENIGPVFHTRYALALSVEDFVDRGIHTQPSIPVSKIYVLDETPTPGLAGLYSSFLPNSEQDLDRLLSPTQRAAGVDGSEPTPDRYFAHPWRTFYRELNSQTTDELLSIPEAHVTHPFTRNPDPMVVSGSTWMAGSIGMMLEQDLGADPGMIEHQLIASAKHLTKQLESAASQARKSADSNAAKALSRWRLLSMKNGKGVKHD